MIDFNFTEERNGIVTYYNMDGAPVKQYPLAQLEKYVTDNLLNLSYSHVGEGWDLDDPKTTCEEVEIYQPVSEYIDENFDKVTKDFYNHFNKDEFKYYNRVQQHRNVFGRQGGYDG